MKQNIKFIIILALVLSFVFFSSCKRKALEEPSPFGPSSLSTILTLSANPNVITASTSRQAASITASFRKYDGTPIANTDVYFEIRDSSGNRAYVGYFEGNQSVVTKTTNSNGKARATYYGPLADELTGNSTVYIYASATWKGEEFVYELAPLDIIRDYEEIIIELLASPNVLVAGTYRGVSTIMASVKDTGGSPLANTAIIFKIPADDSGSPLGYFENNETVVTTSTDSQGKVEVTYFGPTEDEVTEDTTLEIKAWLPDFVDENGQCFSTTTSICIVRELKDLTLELFAQPNVLICSDERPSSQIKAYLKMGTLPLAGRKIFFTVSEGEGTFSNNEKIKIATTDEQGMATVVYRGPTKDEITGDQTVTIQAQPESTTPDSVTAEVEIQLIRSGGDYSIEVVADPDVLLCTDSNPTSTIKALFKEGNKPLANKEITFTIDEGIGLFSNGQISIEATTDEDGIATVTYYGPLSDDLTEDETITIEAKAETSPFNYITDTVSISLIKQE